MTSLRQIVTNSRNAAKGIGPRICSGHEGEAVRMREEMSTLGDHGAHAAQQQS
jgi:hypothetical protein